MVLIAANEDINAVAFISYIRMLTKTQTKIKERSRFGLSQYVKKEFGARE
jgi:hypothetical protein